MPNRILICDSGSTKADWVLLDSTAAPRRVETIGLQPFFLSAEQIAAEIRAHVSPLMLGYAPTDIHFYGSGCSDVRTKDIVERGIRRCFPRENVRIFVDHDLLGAAHATCGTEAGVVGILGTGSNSCLFDGERITDNVPSLGYLLGDEGSGTYLGRLLLRACFYRELPPHLTEKILQNLPGGRSELLENIYHRPRANAYLARFTYQLAELRHHLEIDALIERGLDDFVVRHLLKYEGARRLPVHFVGSIASVFEENLRSVLLRHELQMGRIVSKPIEGLVERFKF